ncbi:MAG: hypothetical protein ACRCS5_07485 [Sphingomonas sp.]
MPNVATIDEIPDDFQPSSLGTRQALIGKIQEIFPTADFNNPGWGIIDGQGWSIEVNIGPETECNGIMLHVRGGEGAVEAVTAIFDHLQFRAIDLQTGDFFEPRRAMSSFEKWTQYRDQVTTSQPSPPPEAKKRSGLFRRFFG